MANEMVETEAPWVRTVVTTAGDVEREAKSRIYNAVEAISIYLLVLVTLWPFCYGLGKLAVPENEFVLMIANWPLVAGALFLLFVSPFLHRDTAESWGVGNPRTLWRLLHQAPMLKRAAIITAISTLMIVLNIANYVRWPDVAKFLGLRGTVAMEFTTAPGAHPYGPVLVIMFGLVVSAFLVTCAIRYDNFGSAFGTALKISIPMLVLTFIAAFAAQGWNAFSGFDPLIWMLGVFGYVFWGAVQQLLFSSYFSTRMRKAFGPAPEASNSLPTKEQRLRSAVTIGGAISAVLVVIGFAICRSLYGAEQAPITLIPWLIGFTLPFSMLWGYFYAVNRRRLLVATICGSFFGLIHIDSYGLVVVTFMLGVMLVYVFMEDKNRNLVALGFIHGLLGSTFGWLFDKKEAGALQVNYSVGPWNIDDPSSGVLIFPMLCIAGYLFLLIWCLQNVREEEA